MKFAGADIISKEQIASLIHPRDPLSHKGTYGHALLVAGNKGKMGAAILAAKACLRSGIGLLTVNVPEAFSAVIHTAVPESMVMNRADTVDYSKYKSIGIGPGLGVDEASEQLVKDMLLYFKASLLVDADALTILSQHKDWLKLIPQQSVLTPHPKEFDRLFGDHTSDTERIDKAVSLSKEYPFVIVLKGHHTLIAADGKGWYNNTGNAGLAKGGSGDILTGILTTLLAQYNSLDAAMIGVYLHGLAADITLDTQSMESMLATDVTDNIGKAFKVLRNIA